MGSFEDQYKKAKIKLLSDKAICDENRELFSRFFDYLEIKLKRINELRALDNPCYNTLYDYIKRLRNVNSWFKNKPWVNLTEEDIKKVYNDLEDGIIKNKWGKPFEDTDRYYSKILKSKPFELAGKADLCRGIIEYTKNKSKEVRFISEEDFRKLVDNAYKPHHKLLLWLAWDYGENINSLLKLRKRDFHKQISTINKEPEYRLNLRKEILKRSRLARSEINNYSETIRLLDQLLPQLKDDDLLFSFDYRNAKKIIDRLVKRTHIKCSPNNESVTWKDLRSGMACELLKKGYSTDEVNARLGHRPSSSEIDKYINFLAIDRHTPKKKIQQFEMEKLNDDIEALKRREKIQAQRNEALQTEVEEQKKIIQKLLKAYELKELYNYSKKRTPNITDDKIY